MKSPALDRVFTERKVYLTDATKFNDPFESRPLLRVSRISVERNMFLKDLARQRFPQADKQTLRNLVRDKRHMLTDQDFLRQTYEELIRSVGVYCLTEKNADLLMWSHYSDCHRGLCIELDPTKEGTLFWEAWKVTYQEDYPTVNIMKPDRPDELRKAHLTKSTHWEYEQEWRILKFEDEGGPGYYPFEPELLTGVILGALICKEDRELIEGWVKSYPTKVALYQAKLNERKYQVDIVPIEGA